MSVSRSTMSADAPSPAQGTAGGKRRTWKVGKLHIEPLETRAVVLTRLGSLSGQYRDGFKISSLRFLSDRDSSVVGAPSVFMRHGSAQDIPPDAGCLRNSSACNP